MPPFDHSDPEARLRTHRGTQLYMAHHPAIRGFLRGRNRPDEHGHKLWTATLDLMAILEEHPARTVLEVGCGWGLLGVHMARRRKAEVLCTDIDPRLEPIVRAMAELNAAPVRFAAVGFAEIPKPELARELVVGCEVCYSEPVVEDLCRLAERCAEAGTGELLIADPGRPDFEDLQRFCVRRFGASLETRSSTVGGKPLNLLRVRY